MSPAPAVRQAAARPAEQPVRDLSEGLAGVPVVRGSQGLLDICEDGLFPGLRKIVLRGEFSDADLQHLPGSLQDLELLHCKGISSAGLAQLCRLDLRSLTARHLHIDAQGAAILAGHPTLSCLDLSHNPIGDEGARALARSTGIQTLRLNDCGIGNAGAAGLAAHPHLQVLELRSNPSLGAEGIRALARSHALRSLDLSDNRLRDAAIAPLGGNRSLTHLALGGNLIGEDGAHSLATHPFWSR